MIGQTLSHYKITSKLGEGGMGEVYRATDTKLNRDVALKVLPEAFAADRERMARFSREAQVLASLNHPNIASIYGLEDSDDKHALVLELVEGDTLAERIQKGAIPLEESLKIALQMAEALEAAHEKGIIHRDLKPANVKITPEGKVKVLDFGLAKALEDESPATDLTSSPTRTGTAVGVIMGTAGYMSPEQARGQAVDKRTDIWAFGCVLYEILTGSQAFGGETVTDILAAIVDRDPEWEALPESTPRAIQRLLRRCLEKDPHERLRDIGDARIEIRYVLGEPVEDSVGDLSTPTPAWWPRMVPWAIAALLAVMLALTYREPPSEPPTPQRFSIDLPSPFAESGHYKMALSPDGNHLVYLGKSPDHQEEIYHRPLDQLEARPIEGTEGAGDLFFSPDGKWVGFHVGGRTLKKVPLAGGPTVTICTTDEHMCGATWGGDGKILFAAGRSLYEVSEVGGAPEKILANKEGEGYCWPQMLPDGDAALVGIYLANSPSEFGVLSLGSDEVRTLGTGMYPRYAPTGHLLYRDRGLGHRAVPFDAANLELVGDPVPVLPEVGLSVDFTFSSNGTLVRIPVGPNPSLSWVTRQGESELVPEAKGFLFPMPQFSPNGKHLSITVDESGEGETLDLRD